MRLTSRFAFVVAAISGLATNTGPAFASPQGTAAIAKAIDMCEHATQGGQMIFPPEAELYFGASDVGTTKALSALPDLLKRYARNGPLSTADTPSLFLRFASPDGEAWSVVRGKTFTCDVVATGFRGSEVDQEIIGQMDKMGWAMVASRPSAVPNGLSQFLLTKMLPASGDPTSGIKAHMKSIGFAEPLASGVQMEIDFAAGQLSIRQPQKP